MDSGNDLIGNRLARARYQRFGARLWFGLICSLAVHGLILSLQFGIPGLGLPALSLPWAERRALAPELSVTLAGVKHAEDAVPPPSPLPTEQAPSVAPGALQVVPPAQREPRLSAASPIRSKSRKSSAPPKARPAARRKAPPPVIARTEPSPDSFKVPAPEPKEQEGEANIEAPPLVQESPAPVPEPAPAEEKPAPPLAPEPDAQLAKLEAQQRDEARKLEEARQQQEARKLEEARKIDEARRAEQARKLDESNMLRRAAEAEARKREEQEATRRAAALAARQEEAKRQEQEQTERKALEMEARRKAEESARQQAAALERQKQAEQLAAKAKADELAARLKAEEAARRQQAEQLAAKQQAELAERQRADAAAAQQRESERRAAQEAQAASAAAAAAAEAAAARNAQKAAAPGSLAGGDFASKALSQARKLDLARDEPQIQAPVVGNPERPVRRSIFGKVDNDIGLSMYIQGWRLKIERNGRLNYSQSSRDRARGDPIVTVALRSDGSVEDIVINRSSGRPELDEAVRRIVRLNARYAAFPPALAHRFDVIEIRRIWSFEDSLKILEELETH